MDFTKSPGIPVINLNMEFSKSPGISALNLNINFTKSPGISFLLVSTSFPLPLYMHSSAHKKQPRFLPIAF